MSFLLDHQSLYIYICACVYFILRKLLILKKGMDKFQLICLKNKLEMSLKLPKIPSILTEEKALSCYGAWGKYNLVLQELP